MFESAPPLTAANVGIPHLIPAKGDPEAAVSWDEFVKNCHGKAEDGSATPTVEPTTGEVTGGPDLYSEDNSMMATITVAPNTEIAKIHDRLPVFIEEADWERYLDPEPLSDEEKHRMIATPPDGFFKYWPVANLAVGPDLKREIKVMSPGEEKSQAAPQPDLFG